MTETSYKEWEMVIGLEIHVQLKTRSKLFSSSPNRFGDEPNTNIGIVDTGQPGSLPILNKEAVEKAVLFGCAIGAEISPFSKFDRKSYFYPDSPRNFQITQFNQPIIRGGQISADVEGKMKEFRINRAHLEDDAGMLKHFNEFAGIDYNRAGAALIEIVSEPCLFSPKEATAFASAIKAILQTTEVADCNMEEGGLRFDVNISVRPKGDLSLRPKVEVKNLNSFAFMEMAIEAEFRRQVRAYIDSPHLPPEKVISSHTCRFDTATKNTVPMRTKEEAEDYRYFPEPDLLPIILSKEYIEEIRNSLPELPLQKYQRYVETLALAKEAAFFLAGDKKLSDYFEEGLKTCKNSRALCNWILVEFAGRLKEQGTLLYDSAIKSDQIATLVNLIDQKKITGRIAKEIADFMALTPGKSPEKIIAENPLFEALHDTGEIELIVDQVLKENQSSIDDYKAGKDKAFNYLVGQVMKLSKGKAAPEIVKELIDKKISS